MAGSALIEVARSLDSSIGSPLSPFLPTQGANAIIFGSSAALVAGAVAGKVFCGSKPISSEKKPLESSMDSREIERVDVATTPALENRICLRVAGCSRAGKTLWIMQFFGGLRTCGNPTLFRGTEHATKYTIKIGNITWEITDTPGLFESNESGQIARKNEVILEQIQPKAGEVVDAIIYTLPQTLTPQAIQSIIDVYNATPKDAKVFVLFTQSENCDDVSIEEVKQDRLSQLMDQVPEELLEKLQKCPVLLSGAINTEVTGSTSDIFNRVATIYKFNADARKLLVNALIEKQEDAEECIAKLEGPFQVQNAGDLEAIAEYINAQAEAICSFIPKLKEKVAELDSIIKDYESIINNPELYGGYYWFRDLPTYKNKLMAIAKDLDFVAANLPEKAKDLKTIATKLSLDPKIDSTLEQLRDKAEEINSLTWTLSRNAFDLKDLLTDLQQKANSIDHTKLGKASEGFELMLGENGLLGDFNFTNDGDLINKLGYLAIAAKIRMKKFVPNMPKWGSHPSLNPSRVANSNLEG